MWSLVNQALNVVFDLWLWPFQGLPVLWQIVALAFPATIFSLLVFRYSSNQDGIRNAKDKIKAHLLELRLFKDDIGVTLMAQRDIFVNSLLYMRYALAPMAVMLIPFVLILVQVESRFAFRGLDSNEPAIVSVTVDSQWQVSQLQDVLKIPKGLVLETPALRIDSAGEILWRISGMAPAKYELVFSVEGQSFNRRIVVDPEMTHIAPSVYRASDIRTLGYPAQPALAGDSPVSSVTVGYPRARGEFAGLSSASWLLFMFTLILGFAMRGMFGVTF